MAYELMRPPFGGRTMVTSYNKEAEVLSDALVDMIEVYFADDPINYNVVTIPGASVSMGEGGGEACAGRAGS